MTTNAEHNEKVFAKIQKLEDEIAKLKETLKPVELVQNASLAECNRIAREQRLRAARDTAELAEKAFADKVKKAVAKDK